MTGLVAVVIVNYRAPYLSIEAVRSIAVEHTAISKLRVVIVDGGSEDGSAERMSVALRTDGLSDWVEVLPLSINGGFGWANNQAILRLIQSEDPPDYVYLLNPDATIEPGAITALANLLDSDPQCAVAGSALVNEDGSLAGSHFRFITPAREFARGLRTNAISRLMRIDPVMIDHGDHVDWVTGASMMIRVAAARQVGLFDTGFFLYFEEIEWCWRLKRSGWTIRHVPTSVVKHIGGATTGMDYNQARTGIASPLPTYWFASRRRMLTRTLGKRRATIASLLWLAGHMLYCLRRICGFGGRHRLHSHEARDLLRFGVVPSDDDLLSKATDCREPWGSQPAWMENRVPRRGVSY